MRYRVTLWRDSDYCKIAKDYDKCAFVEMIEADSPYAAKEKALRPHIMAPRNHYTDYPKIYNVEEVDPFASFFDAKKAVRVYRSDNNCQSCEG